jgi:hypothetical protein
LQFVCHTPHELRISVNLLCWDIWETWSESQGRRVASVTGEEGPQSHFPPETELSLSAKRRYLPCIETE